MSWKCILFTQNYNLFYRAWIMTKYITLFTQITIWENRAGIKGRKTGFIHVIKI